MMKIKRTKLSALLISKRGFCSSPIDCLQLGQSHLVYFSRKLINKTNKLSRRRANLRFLVLIPLPREVFSEFVQTLSNTRACVCLTLAGVQWLLVMVVVVGIFCVVVFGTIII